MSAWLLVSIFILVAWGLIELLSPVPDLMARLEQEMLQLDDDRREDEEDVG